ncbi:carboxypeptidase-like regulatory domain-containing protein [Namhaeicola litoreus]|uniref:Carboxypeptidase-like regulatory domain-containing protein n=1 Tax=Namhaeicola litoreus TaxID=1052145 RepID=A0ABW3Y290_9FLAO
MKKLLFLLAFGLSTFAFAQEVKVTGNVMDAENENAALAFASVRVKELNIEVNTDLEGNFDLEIVPGTYTLVYDFVGYSPVEVKANIVEKDLLLSPVVMKAYQIESPPSLAMNE